MKGQTVFLAGPYEFISDDGVEHALPEAYAPLVKAYEALGYSAGAVSPAEAKQFAALGIAPPSGWQVLDPKEPRAVVLDSARGKIGVVFFPEAKKAGSDPSLEQVQAVNKKFKELRPLVKLVIGVSPWGVQTESDFLEGELKFDGQKSEKPELDVLLGSGSGVGFSAKLGQNGRVLWMHTYTKGKAVYSIELLAWPGDRTDRAFKWEKDANFTSQAVVLDETYAPTPAMEQLLQGIPDPGDKQAK